MARRNKARATRRRPRRSSRAGGYTRLYLGRGACSATTSLSFSWSTFRVNNPGKPLRMVIEIVSASSDTDRLAPGCANIQIFSGQRDNNRIYTVSHLVSPKKVVTYTFPRSLDGFSETDYSQNFLELDSTCIVKDHNPYLAFLIKLWVRHPAPFLPDVCGVAKEVEKFTSIEDY